jgi:hypothetical protein
MTTATTATTTALADLLTACGSQWAPLARGEAQWDDSQNECMADLIDYFADEPDGLQNFDQSDWVNLCECYTYKLIERYQSQGKDVKALFDQYCDAIGATSALEALEGQTIEDPDDMAAAMTYGAQMLASDLWPDR